MRRLAAVLLVLPLATCSGPRRAECQVHVDGYFQFNDVVPVGQSVTYTIGVPQICTSLEGISARVSVLDPARNTVPHRDELVHMKDWLEVRVTFTPTVPGFHHVTGRFEPSLGSNEGDVIAVADGPSEIDAGMLFAPALSTCGRIELTPGGLVVCRAGPIRVYAGDTLIQQLDLFNPAMANGVLWSGDVERWVEGTQADGGRGFRREPDQRVLLSSNLQVIGPTEGDVVVVDLGRRIHRVRFVDGGFAVDDIGVPPQGGSGLPAWWRSGNTVLGVDVPMGCSDAGFDFRVCGMPRQPSSFEPAGVWYVNRDHSFIFDEVILVRADEVLRLQVTNGITGRGSGVWNSTPTFTLDGIDAGVFIPGYRNGRIELIRFTGEVHSATPEWVFLKNPLRAVRREP